MIRMALPRAGQHALTKRISHASTSKLKMSTSSCLDMDQLARMPGVLQKLPKGDLVKLAQETGMPNSGTKALLAARLGNCFSRLLKQITAELGVPKAKEWLETSETHLQEKSSWDRPSRLSLLPPSIISIDVGLRNLAWVQLSREGEVLRWDVEDLLSLDLDSDPDNLIVEPEEVESPHSSKTEASKRSKRSHTKRLPAAPYDPRSLATAIDNLMYKILEQQPSAEHPIGAVIMERQRLRSVGIPGMVDSVVKCCVVEGMMLSWLKHWERQHTSRSQPGQRDFVVDLITPRAVGTWWGIGDALGKKCTKNGSSQSDPDYADSNGDGDVGSSSTTRNFRARYSSKKSQSTQLVQEWISGNHPRHDNKEGAEDRTGRLHVKCPEHLQSWYNAQSKRDDLSDCLLQAVAWYEWQARAIDQSLIFYQESSKM